MIHKTREWHEAVHSTLSSKGWALIRELIKNETEDELLAMAQSKDRVSMIHTMAEWSGRLEAIERIDTIQEITKSFLEAKHAR